MFEAENPHTATSSILDALEALGVPRADSATLTEFGGIERLDSFPFGFDAGKPDWSNESVKVWLIDLCQVGILCTMYAKLRVKQL